MQTYDRMVRQIFSEIAQDLGFWTQKFTIYHCFIFLGHLKIVCFWSILLAQKFWTKKIVAFKRSERIDGKCTRFLKVFFYYCHLVGTGTRIEKNIKVLVTPVWLSYILPMKWEDCKTFWLGHLGHRVPIHIGLGPQLIPQRKLN